MNSSQHNWRIFLASATGTSHLARGRPCDDSSAYHEFSDGSWFAVVADGAGSAKSAAIGAHLAVLEASCFMRNRLNEGLLPDEEQFKAIMSDCLHQTREAISGNATEQAAPISDFATTLIVICVTQHLVAAAQIGDGGIAIRHADGHLVLFFAPNRGEYVNETHFITSSDFAELSRVGVIPRADINGIAVFTDGIEFLAVDLARNLPHAPFFQPLFDFASSAEANSKELEAFLSSQPVCDRTDDDKTLMIAVLP